MKNYDILDRKFKIKKGVNDKDLNSRINMAYYDIFKCYEKLDDDSIQHMRIFIENFFSKLRPTLYKNETFRNELKNLLYPDIYFVGLTHLYSDDGYTQYSFLLRTYDEIKSELNKNIKNKEKIK